MTPSGVPASSEKLPRTLRSITPGIPRLIESNAIKYADLSYKLYIASEFIPGTTLTSAMLNNAPPSFHEAVALVRALLDIVEYFHREGWIHRDIKPDNIILRDAAFNCPILVDFGLGYSDDPVDTFRTEEREELGNRFLRLPELAVGNPVKSRTPDPTSALSGASSSTFLQ